MCLCGLESWRRWFFIPENIKGSTVLLPFHLSLSLVLNQDPQEGTCVFLYFAMLSFDKDFPGIQFSIAGSDDHSRRVGDPHQ